MTKFEIQNTNLKFSVSAFGKQIKLFKGIHLYPQHSPSISHKCYTFIKTLGFPSPNSTKLKGKCKTTFVSVKAQSNEFKVKNHNGPRGRLHFLLESPTDRFPLLLPATLLLPNNRT